MKLEEANGGWEAVLEPDEEIPKKCPTCKRNINLNDFFHCEIKKKYYCADCIREGYIDERTGKHVKSACTPHYNHTDWHIVKVTIKEGEDEEIIE